ncbi:hypothetical protein CLOP_g6995 [Closterium sp. NIES-67]|nr:hypothetical protein CLOP_g6995 [Closterium sp. NIES-67]
MSNVSGFSGIVGPGAHRPGEPASGGGGNAAPPSTGFWGTNPAWGTAWGCPNGADSGGGGVSGPGAYGEPPVSGTPVNVSQSAPLSAGFHECYVQSRVEAPHVKRLLLLRILTFILSLLCISVLVGAPTGQYRFTFFVAYSLLFAMASIAMLYSFLLVLFSCAWIFRARHAWGRFMTGAQMIMDFLLALLLFAAATTAACQTGQNSQGVTIMGRRQLVSLCSSADVLGFGSNHFCGYMQGATALGYLAFFTLLPLYWMNRRAWYKSF